MDTDERRAFWQKVKLRPFMLFVTLSGLVGLLLLTLNPVHSMGFNLIHLGLVLAAWIGVTILGWKWNGLRMVMLGVPLLLMVLFLLPGKEIEVGELRDDYVKRMADFEGTQYSWGGESARGIDCSGLPRRAYRDALLSYGVRHLSGRRFGHGLSNGGLMPVRRRLERGIGITPSWSESRGRSAR